MRAIRNILRSPPAVSLVVGALVGFAVLWIRSNGYLEPWELVAYDWSLRARPGAAIAEDRIVVIGITEDDIGVLGRWPLTDAVMADTVRKLLPSQPRAIGVDIYRDFPIPPGQKPFEKILTTHRHVIMVEKFGRDSQARVGPPPVLKHTDQVGFNDLLVDRDGIVRRALLFLDDGEATAYSFALRLALLYLQDEGITPQPDPSSPQHLRLGPTSFRPLESNDGGYVGGDARGYQVLLDFKPFRSPLPVYPLSSVLSGQVDPRAIQDKIVLVEVAAVSVPDLFHTPYSSGHAAEERGEYGVSVHATIASQLLRAALEGHSPIRTASEPQETIWILLWGILGGMVGIVGRSIWRFLLVTASGLVLLALLVETAIVGGWWIPVVPPAFAWAISAGLLTAYMTSQEKRQRALLMQLFSRHVSPEVADAIWRQHEQFLENGRPRSQQMIVSVLFTDLEGFSGASEKMTPQGLMDWTNTYLDIMAQSVMKHGGVVDDYFGDAIKANFGVPIARTTEAEIKQDAVNAVNCALAMEKEMERLTRHWQEQRLPTARLRVGIYTGPVVAGSLGTAERLKYTTLGDTVNTASRLESWDKDSREAAFGDRLCRILIGESTWQYLDHQFQSERVGQLTLKGKNEKVTVYRIIGGLDQTDPHADEVMQGGHT
jgi:adenylate cyclase